MLSQRLPKMQDLNGHNSTCKSPLAQGKRRISFSNQFSYVGAEAADNERDNYVVRDKNDAAIMLFNGRAIYKYKYM